LHRRSGTNPTGVDLRGWTRVAAKMVAFRRQKYRREGARDCVPPSNKSINKILDNPEKLAQVRIFMGSISSFVGRVKEPLARLFNFKCKVTGSYWAKRFGNRILETIE
jgi:hypothetical protein